MAVLRSLVTTLGMNSAQYRADLQKAQKSTSNFGAQVKKIGKVSTVAFAAAATAAAGAATIMVKESLAANDALAKFSDKIGISTDALAGLQHAGELTGVSMSTMNMGLQRMTRRIADAAQGTGEAVKALDELGLSAQDLNRMSPDQQFKAIAQAMGDVESRSDQVRLAFKLFDSEGVGLLNTLDAGAEGINAMMQEADDLGIAMSRVDAAKLEAANDAMYKAGLGSKALGNTLSVAVSPYITAIANQFTESAKASNGFKDEVMSGMEFVAQSVGYVANVIHGLNVVWEVVEQGAREFVGTAVYNLAALDRAVTATLNKLPGVSTEVNAALQQLSADMMTSVHEGRAELSALLNEPLPHTEVQAWFANVRAEADQAAKAVAESKKQAFSVPDPNESGSGAETAANDNKFEQELEKLRQKYTSEEQLLVDKTLNEQEILINAEAQNLISEQESQELRKQSWDAYYDSVNRAAEDSTQQQAQAQARANQQLAQMQTQLAQQSLGLIKTSAEEGSAIWMTALAAEKGIAIAQALINSEVAATRALAELGPIAGPPMAATMKTMGYASAALIAATGVAEIAGARAMGGEVRYGQTYLVGERGPELFTAGATGQITSNENLQRAIGGQPANQPIQQITFAPTVVVEAGASQSDDEALGEQAGYAGYNLVIEDLQTNGPISKMLKG